MPDRLLTFFLDVEDDTYEEAVFYLSDRLEGKAGIVIKTYKEAINHFEVDW